MSYTYHLFISLAVLICSHLGALECYTVTIEGLDDYELQELIESTAQLYVSQDNPPATLTGLRRRANADLERMTQALQNYAYYTPEISIDITGDPESPHVAISIKPGPIYALGAFKIVTDNESEFDCATIKLKHLALCLDSPAYPEDILGAEELLLEYLGRKSYPLATITDKDIIADLDTGLLHVVIHVDTGPFCVFGPTNLTGNCSIADVFFRRKIWWNQGCAYDPCLLGRTIHDLESSNLFEMISIEPASELNEDGELPMEIIVEEGKQRSYGFGGSFATQLGFGVLGEWEHRNFRGVGERVTAKAHIRQALQEAKLQYVIPDFCIPQQDFVWLAELQRQQLKAYHDSFFSFSGTIDRQLNDETRISYGLMYKRLFTSHSDNNGAYNLIKMPMQFHWAHIDNVLNPGKGSTLTLKSTPSFQAVHPRFSYNINTVTATHYKPLRRNRSIVFATRIHAGTIFGASRYIIPSSERFYAGSESTIRGYRYLTVSPLDGDKPIGGRSIFVLSTELRFHFTECWGGALFYDIGNVYAKPVPELTEKQLQAVGFGVRYYTPVGPLRLDFAFPLNPRHKMHDHMQIYMSIGQTF